MAWFAAQAQAGAWGRDPGAVYAQLGWRHTTSTSVFGGRGATVPLASELVLGESLAPLIERGHYESDALATYVEVGALPWLTVVGALPLQVARTRWTLSTDALSPAVHHNAGLGDLELGARVHHLDGGLASAATAVLRLPLYDNAPEVLGIEAGNADFFDDRVPLGPGTVDLDLLGALGVGRAAGWVQLEGGARLRDRLYSTVVLGRVELGARPLEELALVARCEGRTHLADGEQPDFFADELGLGPTILDRARALVLSAGMLVRTAPEQPLGAAVDLAHVVAGERLGRTSTVQLSLTWETP